ncbi:hypothetical protein QEJ31_12955 [Pigmentibacter sp. JX0631]|uniref:hypothetical protein n=1 Tax=Pigmentibacter sp. JX0631 TaxID=2976982 RepID=UPI002468F5E6|nr:hypothetical protein [Pigmentibacter sp. JX0631]WGL59433.1 hypothetical protein QEJ31_12955 [Pigmentibacter sp. JX0631]
MRISNLCKISIVTFFTALSLSSVAKEENPNLIFEDSGNSNEIDYKDGIYYMTYSFYEKMASNSVVIN